MYYFKFVKNLLNKKEEEAVKEKRKIPQEYEEYLHYTKYKKKAV